MQIGVYTRLSEAKKTAETTDNSILRQEQRCRQYAQAKGWRVVEHYSDVDVGAFRAAGKRTPPRRSGFERMLADVEAGRIQGILFAKLDRLVRDHGDFERVLAVCEAHKAVLTSLVEALDTSTPYGQAMVRNMVTYARMESQTTSQRVAWQREQDARAGKPRPGANRPYGYQADRVTVIPAEAGFVRQAAEGLLAGKSLRSVTRELNQAGSVPVAGGQWTTVKLRRTLLAPHQAGLRSYRGQIVAEGQWEAILERGTWEAVRALLRDPKRGRGGRPRRWLLVGGLARCGYPDCGAPLIVRNDGHGKAHYRCESSRQRPGWQGCGRIAIRAEPLEELVTELVFARDWSPVDLKAVREVDAEAVAGRLERDKRKLVELAERYAADELTGAEWLAARDVLAGRIAAAQEQLDRDRQAAAAPMPEGNQALRDAWQTWTLDQRRALLDRLLVAVIVKPVAYRGRPTVDPDRIDPRWRA